MHPWTLSFADFIYFLPYFACQIIWYLHLICKLITWCLHFAASAVAPFYKEIRFLEFSGLLIFYLLCWLRWWYVFSMRRRICRAYKNTTAQWCAMLSFVFARMVECPCEKFDTTGSLCNNPYKSESGDDCRSKPKRWQASHLCFTFMMSQLPDDHS